MTTTSVSAQTIRVIAEYTPALLTAAEWKLARPLVTSLVSESQPTTTETARVALSFVCRFLVTCSAWDRTTAPNPDQIFTSAQFDHVDAQLAVTGCSINTRTNLRSVVRKLTLGRSRMATPVVPRSLPSLPAPRPLTTASTQWQIRAWLIPHLETPSNFVALDHVLRLSAGRSGLTDGFLDAALPYLAWDLPSAHTDLLAGAVTPMPRPAKQPPRPMKRTSAAAARRAAKAARSANSDAPVQPVLPSDVAALIDNYCPRTLTEAEYAPDRSVTAEFVRTSSPTGMRNARRLLSYTSAYATWVRTSAEPAPTVRALADLRLLDRYINTGLAHLSDGTRATHRSTLATAIAAILSGGRRQTKVAYRGGSAPYTPAEEQAFLLLARHQPTLIKRARLATVIALGAGAGLDSSDLRGVRPADIEVLTDPADVFKVTVRSGRRPRTVVVRTAYRELLAEALCLHREAGFSDADTLLGCDENRNVASRVIEQSLTATGEPVRIEITRLRATWLLAVMHAQVPLTVILQTAGLKSARPIADLIAYLPEADPTDFAQLLAGAGR